MAEALEQLKSTRSLTDLNPRIGEKVQIESRSPRARFAVQLLGYREGGSLLVSAPKKHVAINEGARVNVRLMSGNYICGFSARVLKIHTTPFSYWHLEYPEDMEVRRIRSHTRVPVNLVVSVDEFEPGKGLKIDWPVTAYCSDISIQGARIDAPQVLGREGDKLFVTARFQVAGVDQVVLTPAVIRSVQPAETIATKVITHGLEFLELDEDTHLMLTGFVYQQFLIETGHLEIIA